MLKKTLAIIASAALLIGSLATVQAEYVGNAFQEEQESISGNDDISVEPVLPESSAVPSEAVVPEEEPAFPEDREYTVASDQSGKYTPYDGAKYSLTYTVEEDGIVITGIVIPDFFNSHNDLGKLVIPDEINGVAVTTIGDYAFSHDSFTGDLNIPRSVTAIGKGAFFACVGFTGDLNIPHGVTTIGEEAFYRCIGFEGNLAISSSVTYIGERAFYECEGLKGNLFIPSSVTTIGNEAFYSCSGFKDKLVIEDAGDDAMTIGDLAFMNCGFTSGLVIPTRVTTIGDQAFYDCDGFTGELVIREGVTSIGVWAFGNCTGLTGSLVIPSSVTTIGGSAFMGCTGFTEDLVIEEGVTTIGGWAFSGCSGFTGGLDIPSSVTTLESSAFYGCSGFTGSLDISSSVTAIGDSAFEGCSGFTGDLVIPSSVTTIGDSAFEGCSGFTGNLVIPSSVTTIGSSAFGNCSGLTGSLDIPSSVTAIGGSAFSGCSGFTGDLVIPSGVTTIGSAAFYGCSGFTGDLVIPSSVTAIGNWTFLGCSGFTGDLVIPSSVTSIGQGAFYNCSGFTGKLDFAECGITEIDLFVFDGCSGLTGNLVIPESVTSIGDRAFWGCGFTGDLVIPKNVKTIAWDAFGCCSGFSGKLILQEGVTTLDRVAFLNCSGLTGDIIIPKSMETIEERAFEGCTGLKSAAILGKTTTIAHGALEPIKYIYGYRGSTAETYAEENDCIFIPLNEASGDSLLKVTGTDLDMEISVPMSDIEKLRLLLDVLADFDKSNTIEEASLEISISKTEPAETDKQMVDDFVTKAGLAVGQYLDITLNLWIGSEKENVTHTNTPIRFIIGIPEKLQQEDRIFAVVRLHDGVAEILEDMDDDPATVTIETDCFSTYVLAYENNADIVSCNHNLTKTDAVAATCEKNGNVEYWSCSKCGKKYADAEGNREITDVVVKATGHTPGSWSHNENNHWKTCSVCHKELDKSAHSYIWVVDQAATENKTGIRHEECVCGAKRNEGTVIPKLEPVNSNDSSNAQDSSSSQIRGNATSPITGDFSNDAGHDTEFSLLSLFSYLVVAIVFILGVVFNAKMERRRER